MTIAILGRVEILYTYKMLGICGHLRNRASRGLGGGKISQEEGAAKHNSREVEKSLVCTDVSLGGMRCDRNEEERCRKVQIAKDS